MRKSTVWILVLTGLLLFSSGFWTGPAQQAPASMPVSAATATRTPKPLPSFTRTPAAGATADTPRPLPTFTPRPAQATATPSPSPVVPRSQNMMDLLEQGRIEVEASGSGIDEVWLRVRRLTDEQIKVSIPVGTFFSSNSDDLQDMVTRRVAHLSLLDDDWQSLSVEAACADRELDVPGGDHTLTPTRVTDQYELSRLVQLLGNANLPFEVEQAAIWIITDDADYKDLGKLVTFSMSSPMVQPRAIDQDAAIRALLAIARAGIDVSGKRIWQDREMLARDAASADLRDWLVAQEEVRRVYPHSEMTLFRTTDVDNAGFTSLAYSPDGATLATVNCLPISVRYGCMPMGMTGIVNPLDSGQMGLWPLDQEPAYQLVAESPYPMTGLAWSPDGKWLAVGTCAEEPTTENDEDYYCPRGEVRMIDARSWDTIERLSGFMGFPKFVSFSPDGRLLAASGCAGFEENGCAAGQVTIWGVPDGAYLSTIDGFAHPVWNFAFSPDSEWIAAPSRDAVAVFDVRTGQSVKELPMPPPRVSSVAWAPDGRLAAANCDSQATWGCYASQIRIWPSGLEGRPRVIYTQTGVNVGLIWSSDSRFLAGFGGRTLVWDARTGFQVGAFEDPVWDAAFAPDGESLALALHGPAVVTRIDQLHWQPDGTFDPDGTLVRNVVEAEMRAVNHRNKDQARALWDADGHFAEHQDDGNVLEYDAWKEIGPGYYDWMFDIEYLTMDLVDLTVEIVGDTATAISHGLMIDGDFRDERFLVYTLQHQDGDWRIVSLERVLPPP